MSKKIFIENMKLTKEKYTINEIMIHNIFIYMNRKPKLFWSIFCWISCILSISMGFLLLLTKYFGIYIISESQMLMALNYCLGSSIFIIRSLFGLVLAYFSHVKKWGKE